MNRAERRKAAKEQRNNNIGRNTNSKKVNRTIGFGTGTENISNEEEFTLADVQQHDLVKYGMMH